MVCTTYGVEIDTWYIYVFVFIFMWGFVSFCATSESLIPESLS